MGDIRIAPTGHPTPQVGASEITFLQMKTDVAAYYGMDDDPAKVSLAGREIQRAIHELNTKQQWIFNIVESPDITTTSGVDTVTLPTDFWKIYNARKKDAIDYTLNSLRQVDFDRLFQSQVNITGFPYVMVVRNSFRDGTVQLFPKPDQQYIIRIRYVKLIALPRADSDTLDMPAPYQNVPYLKALSRFGALTNQMQKAKYFEDQYQGAYLDMRRSDEDEGEEQLRFLNIEEVTARFADYVNPAARPRMYDFF